MNGVMEMAVIDRTILDVERQFAEVAPGFERALTYWKAAVEANAQAQKLAAKSKIYARLAADIAKMIRTY